MLDLAEVQVYMSGMLDCAGRSSSTNMSTPSVEQSIGFCESHHTREKYSVLPLGFSLYPGPALPPHTRGRYRTRAVLTLTLFCDKTASALFRRHLSVCVSVCLSCVSRWLFGESAKATSLIQTRSTRREISGDQAFAAHESRGYYFCRFSHASVSQAHRLPELPSYFMHKPPPVPKAGTLDFHDIGIMRETERARELNGVRSV